MQITATNASPRIAERRITARQTGPHASFSFPSARRHRLYAG
jgi:hypothetical protein